MKTILGIDLGTTSIGWALVKEAEKANEKSEIQKLGVRLVPLSTDERDNFQKGKSITTNADRTLKRSMRRNLQRYKLRRTQLLQTLKEEGWIDETFVLAEQGPSSTFSTLHLRAKAVSEEISLQDLAKVLLQINKKRGYKSSRKLNQAEDGEAVDGMEVAKELFNQKLTPGEYVFERIKKGQYVIPEFYKSDLKDEFDKIWDFQKSFHPEKLSDSLYDTLSSCNKTQTWTECHKRWGIEGKKITLKGKDRLYELYRLRKDALQKELNLEDLTLVFQEINGQLSSLSGLLSNISDRSKELHFRNLTVGQKLLEIIEQDPNASLKNIVFYRQDYIDEFTTIWDTQKKFHPELTDTLKKKIQNKIIFYHRALKSQKGLVSHCEFEVRHRVCPRSSPLFQEFKIWQEINNLTIDGEFLSEKEKLLLFQNLSFCEKLSASSILKILSLKIKSKSLNYKELDGNRTLSSFLEKCKEILEQMGIDLSSCDKLTPAEQVEWVERKFSEFSFNSSFLHFDSQLKSPEFENQPCYKLWHLLYSYEGDKSQSGQESLIKKLQQEFSLNQDAAKKLASTSFLPDYANLSAKAIRKILPSLRAGLEYSAACTEAGYRHSKRSLTKEELENKNYKDHLDLIPKNSLRNPVVEKILNQMVNVVNSVIDTYGKPDEIRIEMARELKKSAKEREESQKAISKANSQNEQYVSILKNVFHISKPTRNDIIRYRLYEELKDNGYKTLYSNTYIPREDLFSNRFEIEHIIPQSRLFDDSFTNKTLETHDANIAKGNKTAFDYVSATYGDEYVQEYIQKINRLKELNSISKVKATRLLMKENEIPDDFINRELRDSQYIARKAKEILETAVKDVVSTTGSVTARLREDWQLVNLMKELNLEKYEKLGMVEYVEGRDGRTVSQIKDWTKRNDHRHHAMDALTIAFTRRQYIQYLNHLNARINDTDKADLDLRDFDLEDLDFERIEDKDKFGIVHAIQEKYLYRDEKGKLRFVPPIPMDSFRSEARKQLESVLISFKAKNKVMTSNVNHYKIKSGKTCVQLTPRGSLHNETIYGSSLEYVPKYEKIGASFTAEKISCVAKKSYRDALMKRLEEFGMDPSKAFTGKNALSKNPVWINDAHSEPVPEKVKIVTLQPRYTIRKAVGPDLKIDKVIDPKIQEILRSRLEEYGGNASKAFSNLDENPIWLNKDKGIAIKRVTISGVANPVSLRNKKDERGKLILGKNGFPVDSDFVTPGNNHHIAIFKDTKGKLQEYPVSFMKAVARVTNGEEVVDKNYNKDEGWEFLFTLKQNEYFVFPNADTGFNPADYDLEDPKNYPLISPNLYRVQKITSGDYYFRHHLETTVDENANLKGITWKRIGPSGLKDAVKVRIDNLGRIVKVGEYD